MSPNNRELMKQAFVNVIDRYKLAVVTATPVVLINDRFTTKWSGFNDYRAVHFKKMEESEKESVRPTLSSVPKGKAALAWTNQAADEYQRLRHEEDRLNGDGAGIEDYPWEVLTRGEKLRWLTRAIETYGDLQWLLHSVVGEISGVIKATEDGINVDDIPISDVLSECAGICYEQKKGIRTMQIIMMDDGKVLGLLKEACHRLLRMVREEINNGWDWEVGISKQMEFGKMIMETWFKDLSQFFFVIVRYELERQGGVEYVKRLVNNSWPSPPM
ncbi:hypothetical protein VTL71DRAFT_42 [Oculimacula yallundae]|uniref:Uncharacterized protein n=1 Tax=Oculimacula yallundae TaxID=86028 RepID=A0ABR4CYU2_9HELO